MANIPLISVVDDDNSVRESVECLLRSVRFGVVAFAAAEEFLSSDRVSETDCLIADVRMPGMNGLELQSRLVASHPEMPVIFITAHGDEELRSRALRGETFKSAQEFLVRPRAEVPSCLVLDVKLPGLSGLDLQQELAKADLQIPIIFLTGHGDIPMSVRAMKSGAFEFFTKPFDDEALLAAIRQAIARYQVPNRGKKGALHSPETIVGSSAALKAVLNRVASVAPTESTVLILGETGTGKELVAHAIHGRSQRSSRPLVSVNCAAIQPSLIASELFGLEKGAFTGALQLRRGRF